MKYISTRGAVSDLKTALLQGLAPDGGLYLPEQIPAIAKSTWQHWKGLSFAQLAEQLAAIWFQDNLDATLLKKITHDAYTFDIPLQDLGNNQSCCELFHGPSLSFKDVAAQFLMRILDTLLERDNEQALVLTATSGDTGSAVAAACHGRKRIRTIILYPQGRISRVQEQQIATWGGNVQAVSVAGIFDDCQRLVKARLTQPAPQGWHLTSANSINIGRLIPQTFYYWFAALQHPNCVIVVPTGNIGNLTAGVIAQRMGAPIAHFVAASNANDALPRYLQSGTFTPHATHHTISNAMDVGNPSNFERLSHLFDQDATKMATMISGCVVSDDETRATMKMVWDQHHYLMDPHTAVAWTALTRLQKQFAGHPMIALGTAHPAKFPEVVAPATGQVPPVPASLQAQMGQKSHKIDLNEPSETAFSKILDSMAL
ncbi:MAG: threonine synthase [Deltaproteobacteria bacterium CG11_big_fil_rev_8_21_14_0_20_47_16]|nr:MAG: threonine synthase [Deltaproteobacteria bacterium CG11_big_fil_rev_8_21_14_0_20_47_16]